MKYGDIYGENKIDVLQMNCLILPIDNTKRILSITKETIHS